METLPFCAWLVSAFISEDAPFVTLLYTCVRAMFSKAEDVFELTSFVPARAFFELAVAILLGGK